MNPVVLASSLLVLLAAIAAAFLWQERRRIPDGAVIYGVEDSIRFIADRLDSETRAALSDADVRRILEWEVRYLQDPSVRSDGEAPAVAGSIESAVFVQERALAAGHGYDGPHILEVLRLQAEYLAAIGAVGEPVHDETAAPVAGEGGGA